MAVPIATAWPMLRKISTVDSVDRVARSNLSIRASRFGVERHRNLAVHDLVDVGFAHGRGGDVVGHHALAEVALQEGFGFGDARGVEILRERVQRGRLEHIDAKSARRGRSHRGQAARRRAGSSHRARTCRGSASASRPARRALARARRHPDRSSPRCRCRRSDRQRGHCRRQHQQPCETNHAPTPSDCISFDDCTLMVPQAGCYEVQMGMLRRWTLWLGRFCSFRDAPRPRTRVGARERGDSTQ